MLPQWSRCLRQFCRADGHFFWAEDISIRDLLEAEALITHAQITDVYLLGLAVQMNGKLATLDRRIPAAAVRGGRNAIELIPA